MDWAAAVCHELSEQAEGDGDDSLEKDGTHTLEEGTVLLDEAADGVGDDEVLSQDGDSLASTRLTEVGLLCGQRCKPKRLQAFCNAVTLIPCFVCTMVRVSFKVKEK